MNYLETKDLKIKAIKHLQKVSKPQYLWHSNYWDGPLSGICLFENKKCSFQFIDEARIAVYLDSYRAYKQNEYFDNDKIRLFVIVELTDEQIKEEEYWHSLFEEHVGTHTNYDENNKCSGCVKPESGWNVFFDKAKLERKKTVLDNNQVLAYYYSHEFDLDQIIKDILDE